MPISNFRTGNGPENQVCLFNDLGYCKFRGKCRKRHYQLLCSRNKCDRKCEARHPRMCKFGDECDFLRKKICAYKHVTLSYDEDKYKAPELS